MENIVYVYDKHMNLIATFDGNTEGLSNEEMRNLMVSPTVHIETNGESTLSFQMLVNTEKWQTIRDPENIYFLNDRYYTALNENSFQYQGTGNARVVNVTLPEIWYLLDKKFTQIYNCGIYCYAKAKFSNYTTDGAIFTISSTDCSNAGDTITPANAWTQVKMWETQNEDGSDISYPILQSENQKPTNWESVPSAVFFESFSVSGNTATVKIKSRTKKTVQKSFEYAAGKSYALEDLPYPASLISVSVTSTVTTKTEQKTTYTTSTKDVGYSYSNGRFSISYTPAGNETIANVSCQYEYYDLGSISSGATCYFAYGPEVVDEHTIVILPKAKSKYKLTINGVEYDDDEVKDSRGVIMPRGSAGYAMWAILKDSGWSLGICDVIATGFDTSIDYGCFNIESDMKDILYNVQYVQELYGGILDWDSKNKVLNYRAENYEDYEAYSDGFNDWTGYEFRSGKNMTDQPDITVDNNITTKGYLIGYGNLNVKNVNGGKSYVEDYSYTDSVYEGYLEQSLIYDTNDEGGQRQLLYWGKKEIKKRSRPRKTISANVTDIRTTSGYEHEVFDINNVVRIYYRDTETDQEIYEDQRIILWEYNAFALYDCTVEMGDKTQNLSQLFKLIYNKAVEDAPSTDASGKVSSNDLVIDVPNYAFDPSGIGGYGSGYGNSLSDYIELIARTTTANSDAVAGLILETTDLYSRAELFATYQKQTDELFSQTYSGLTVYADEKVAELAAIAEGHWTQLGNDLNSLEVYTRAGFEAQANQNEAFTRQFSELEYRADDLEDQIKETTYALAEFKTYVSEEYARATVVAKLDNKVEDLENDIITVSNAQASFEAEVTKNYARTEMLSQYAKTTYVDGKVQTLNSSIASVRTWASETFASVDIEAEVNGLGSHFTLTSSYITMYASNATKDSIRFTLNSSGSIAMYGTGSTYISTTGRLTLQGQTGVLINATKSLTINGKVATWIFSTTLNGYYLGVV